MNGLKLWKEPVVDKVWRDPFVNWVDLFFENPSFVEKSYKKSNIITNDDDYRIQLAVPGLTKEDIKISINDSIINISHEQKETDDKTFYFTSTFKKEYSLPNDCNEKDINSKMENGVLEIIIPRDKKKAKERYIEIT